MNTSEAQRKASQENSKHSTGPKSGSGKRKVARQPAEPEWQPFENGFTCSMENIAAPHDQPTPTNGYAVNRNSPRRLPGGLYTGPRNGFPSSRGILRPAETPSRRSPPPDKLGRATPERRSTYGPYL